MINKRESIVGKPSVDILLNTVSYTKEEDPFYKSDIYDLMSDFFQFDIYKLTGLNYRDYMNLNKAETDLIVQFIQNKMEAVNTIMEDLPTGEDKVKDILGDINYDEL